MSERDSKVSQNEEPTLELHSEESNLLKDEIIPTSTIPRTTFNLVNTIIGGGALALPFGFKNCGLLLGSVLVLSVGLISYYSAHLLIKLSIACRKFGLKVPTYKGLVTYLFGKTGSIIVDISSILFLWGAMVGYLVIIQSVAFPLFQEWTRSDSPMMDKRVVLLFILVFIVYPLCLLKKIDSLSYTSIAAVCCISFLVLCIMIRSIQNLSDNLNKEETIIKLHDFSLKVFGSIPVISFAFSMHLQMFPLWNELKKPTSKRIHIVVASAMSICAIVYLVIGIFGYLTFFDSTTNNILEGYSDDTLIEVGKIGYSLMICFSYPLMCFPARISFELVFFPSKPASNWRRIVIVTCFCCLTYVLAIAVPNITVVFSFVGSTVGNLLIFIMPALCYLVHTWKNERENLKSLDTLLSFSLFITGIFFSILGIISIFTGNAD